MPTKFEVAISGISGRFPECDDVNTLRNKLYSLDNFITVNNKKWSTGYKYKFGSHVIPNGTGKYTSTEPFDIRVFKLNPELGVSYDILNRKVLEPSFEAIVDAGVNPYSLDGENVGVFMSCGINEVESKLSENDSITQKKLIGISRTMQSNRVSYAFNFTGPSYTYQTDVFGSLQALSSACNSIADGMITAAIVGVASNMMDPKVFLQYLGLQLLSPDGLCRAFDKHANGYGRSESTVVLFLQRNEDAKRNYASVLFCDTYYFGLNPSTILGYKEDTLKTILETMYAENHFLDMSSELAFMELNACGIKKLESMESNSVAEVVCRNRRRPLLVGSVKSNVGHTEASAAFMSLLKTLFALDTDVIAPNANLNSVNAEIDAFKNKKLQVVDKVTNLNGNLIAVNAIGLGGILSHAVLRQNPKKSGTHQSDAFPRLLLICGRMEDGLRNTINKIEQLPFNPEFVALTNDAFSSHMPAHLYRGFTILPKSSKATSRVEERGDRNRPVWFVFSGMGSQWNGMGKGLLDIPIFAEVIDKCDLVLRPKGINIYHILTSDDPTLFENILNSFVAIICVQIGLVEILKALCIEPDGIIGHSLGETSVAYADGCLTLEQAVMSAYIRGMASVGTKTIRGMMAAVGKGYNEIKDLVPEDVQVACHNSNESCTLSGPEEKVEKFLKTLIADGIFARIVNTGNIAYHSKYVAPAAPKLLSQLENEIRKPRKRSTKWISTSIPECDWNKPLAKYCSAEYLTNNFVNPVLFEEGCKHIPHDSVLIEIAPHGLLQAILKRAFPATCTNVSLTCRSKNPEENVYFLLSAIGKLYIAGCEPNVNAIFPKVNYPVSRNTPSISPFCDWFYEDMNSSKKFLQPNPEKPLSSELIPIQINEDADFHYLKYHKINGQIIIPPSLHMYLVWWMFSVKRNEKVGSSSVVFENVKVHKHMRISIKKPRFVTIMIQASGDFEVLQENESNQNSVVVILSGKIEAVHEHSAQVKLEQTSPNSTNSRISEEQFYSKYKNAGFQLTNCFAPVREIFQQENACYSKITWNDNWVTFLDSLMKLQMFSNIRSDAELRHPYFVRKLTICCQQFLSSVKKGDVVLCHQDLVTKKIQCKGLEMYGFVSKKSVPNLLPVDSFCTGFVGLQFVSYANPECKNARQFLELCLHLAVQNVAVMGKSLNPKLFILRSALEHVKGIRSVIKQNNTLKSKIKFFDDQDLQLDKSAVKNKCFLLVARDFYSANGYCFDHLFLLMELSSPTLHSNIEDSFVPITKQIFSGKLFCLYKKKPFINRHSPAVVYKSNDSKNIRDFDSNNKEGPRFIVHQGIETNDISLILSPDKIADCHSRYIFLADHDNKSLNDADVLIKSQIDKDLPISILKNGAWGTYRRNFTDGKLNEIRHKSRRGLKTAIRLETVDVRSYTTDCSEEPLVNAKFPKTIVHGIEYSGIHCSGKRVMGVAVVDHSQQITQPDPILAWQIPKEWSFEDAVTVPFICTQTHYIELLTHGFGFASSILINQGDKYLLTETCISLYLRKNYSVYVTVSTREEAANILKKFPKLEKSHIFYENKCSYANQLLQLTKGKGVDIIVNCLSGFKHVVASLNCVGKFAYYVEIGNNNCSDVYSLGMNPFLKSIACILIPNEISFLVNLPEETKEILRTKVEDDIKWGLVSPMPKVIVKQSMPEDYQLQPFKVKSVVRCSAGNEITENSKLKYGDNSSYIIVGDGDSWFDLGKWLVGKGVRKLIVILDDITNTASTSYRCQTIFNTKKLSISFKSSEEISTIGNAIETITAANQHASLQAIYFVSHKGVSEKIRNMDTATQACNANVPLISLFSGGIEQLELRHSIGLPAVVIHADNNVKKLPNVLSVLDDLLQQYSPQSSTNFYEILGENLKPETKIKFSKLSSYLPTNLKTLENTGNDANKTIVFRERASLSAPYSEIKGVYPVFVIPIVDASHIDPLLRRLFYPVFCASLSECSYTMSEMSSEIFQALNKIQPCGPVTILSEAWNAGVAIEVASLISSTKREVKLFLLEGDPYQWKKRIESLGNIHSTQFDDNFVKQMFAFNSKINFDMDLNSTDTLEEKIKCCLSKFDTKEVNRESVIKAAYALRNQLRIASQYDVKDKVLDNVTLFLQNFSENSPLKLSVSSDIVLMEDGISYDHFIRNKKISQRINNNAAFSWWDHPK